MPHGILFEEGRSSAQMSFRVGAYSRGYSEVGGLIRGFTACFKIGRLAHVFNHKVVDD